MNVPFPLRSTETAVGETPVRIRGIGTALPPHRLTQEDVEHAAGAVLRDSVSEFDRLALSFKAAGIDARYSVAPLEWFADPGGWHSRMELYREGALALFIEAARAALLAADLKPADVDTVVTISTTGIVTPTLDALAFEALGLRRDVQRVPVFGLGCAGGVSGLSIAQRLAASRPGSNVLLVAVEACTLAFRRNRPRKADMIATMLFGDGAAAVCLSTAAGGAVLGSGAEFTWPATLDVMGWDIHDDGFGVVFDRSIPAFLCSHFAAALDTGLAQLGLARSRIARFICHPGGAKVVQALEAALELSADTLDHERSVLRRYGNMSSPTVLFVLKDVLEAPPQGPMLLTALGPGFTAAMLPLHADV
ncbi:type III polyketide synthase [Algihabitans albus]|uniref:type III polyketide synthase n=1 Tax=Algihabitans albus TaxID=2164067 RepID=UPI000E5CDD90|nr:3-oxoacyl-[acyl-carrier-protein] synthase III C-terminal domain-containing protein [Algihabitans albus]